jgi:rubrerythrin
MSGELTELLDTAIYEEIASQAFYIAGQSRTEDPGAIVRDKTAKRMCERLVHEELRHKLRLEIFYDDFFHGED